MQNTYDTPTYPELGNIYPGDYYEALPYDEFIDKNQKLPEGKKVFDIRDFGARPEKDLLNTEAFLAAAAACEKAESFDVDKVKEAAAGLSIIAPEGKITINSDNQHISKKVRIGEISEDGLIYEVWSTDEAVEPDPYLKTYDWAVKANIQPIE